MTSPTQHSQTPLPSFAYDLLAAAKLNTFQPADITPEARQRCLEQLQNAVIEFEARMPLKNGADVVQD